MTQNRWSAVFLGLGSVMLGSTLLSLNWILAGDSRWGLRLDEYCGSGPCYTHPLGGGGVFGAAGPLTFYVTLLCILAYVGVLLDGLRKKSPMKPPMQWLRNAATLLTGVAALAAILFVAHVPHGSASGLGWCFPVFLHGCSAALLGVWMSARQ